MSSDEKRVKLIRRKLLQTFPMTSYNNGSIKAIN